MRCGPTSREAKEGTRDTNGTLMNGACRCPFPRSHLRPIRRRREKRDRTVMGRERTTSGTGVTTSMSLTTSLSTFTLPTPFSRRSRRYAARRERMGSGRNGEGDEPKVTKKRAGIDHSRRHTGPFTSVSAHPRLPLLTTFPPVTKDD